jgi:hypothetical protein
MADMTADNLTALRKPFAKEQVGKLPKPYKADSPRGNCKECGQYHGLPAVHLDYVGHAIVTDRLLNIDPLWNWEPMGTDTAGLPALDRNGNLWIKLTVCGVTRLGVGDGPSMKVMIGDAIRNAAMRFGVALDLWAKEELEHPEGTEEPESQPGTDPMQEARQRVREAANVLGINDIPQQLAARNYSSSSVKDLNDLAAEWEAKVGL